MFKQTLTQLRPALMMLVVLTVLTGLAYPGLVTVIGQALFPGQASGSLVVKDGVVVGSKLIGQPFNAADHFWGRPSATSPKPNDASSSSGSNMGPANPDYLSSVEDRLAKMRQANGDGPVPQDLVTASASGLDPDISPAAAFYQVARVAKAKGLAEETVRKLVQSHVQGRTLGLFGEPRVNVLELNLALDAMPPAKP
jgi:K+-transporting ATPase ATPase C chain